MSKIITFFNKKGGTGKTSLSYSIAKDFNYPLLSNDDSVIEEIYPNKAKVLDKLELIDHNVVYDLGGFIDRGIKEIFKASSIIIIPTTLDINSIKRTINSIIEINDDCDNIIIVINRVQKNKISKYKESIKALESLKKEIVYIRESEAITNSIHLGKTISELYNVNNFSKNQYKGIYEDYTNLLNTIKGV